MISPAPLQGLQDWYLRASDGEWDGPPGFRIDPRAAAHAWADLPAGAARESTEDEPLDRASSLGPQRP